jgi:hypothetical protein
MMEILYRESLLFNSVNVQYAFGSRTIPMVTVPPAVGFKPGAVMIRMPASKISKITMALFCQMLCATDFTADRDFESMMAHLRIYFTIDHHK